jgi:hypothetical protein
MMNGLKRVMLKIYKNFLVWLRHVYNLERSNG